MSNQPVSVVKSSIAVGGPANKKPYTKGKPPEGNDMGWVLAALAPFCKLLRDVECGPEIELDAAGCPVIDPDTCDPVLTGNYKLTFTTAVWEKDPADNCEKWMECEQCCVFPAVPTLAALCDAVIAKVFGDGLVFKPGGETPVKLPMFGGVIEVCVKNPTTGALTYQTVQANQTLPTGMLGFIIMDPISKQTCYVPPMMKPPGPCQSLSAHPDVALGILSYRNIVDKCFYQLCTEPDGTLVYHAV